MTRIQGQARETAFQYNRAAWMYAQITTQTGQQHFTAEVYQEPTFTTKLLDVNFFHPWEYALQVGDRVKVFQADNGEYISAQDTGVFIGQVRHNYYNRALWNAAYGANLQDIGETFQLGMLLYEFGLPPRDDGLTPSQGTIGRALPTFWDDEDGVEASNPLSTARVWTRRVYVEQVILRRNSMPIPIGTFHMVVRLQGNYYIQAPIFYY